MSYYVKRSRPGVVGTKRGWTGPIRSERQAHRERAAWTEAGWEAEVVPSSPAVRAEVRKWENTVRVRS